MRGRRCGGRGQILHVHAACVSAPIGHVYTMHMAETAWPFPGATHRDRLCLRPDSHRSYCADALKGETVRRD